MCACVRERERVCVCVCVCVRAYIPVSVLAASFMVVTQRLYRPLLSHRSGERDAEACAAAIVAVSSIGSATSAHHGRSQTTSRQVNQFHSIGPRRSMEFLACSAVLQIRIIYGIPRWCFLCLAFLYGLVLASREGQDISCPHDQQGHWHFVNGGTACDIRSKLRRRAIAIAGSGCAGCPAVACTASAACLQSKPPRVACSACWR